MLCSTPGLEYVKKNFIEYSKLFPFNAMFIDVLTAASSIECYDREHPLSKWDDISRKLEMINVSKKHFPVFGSEHGFKWGVNSIGICSASKGDISYI